MIMKNAMMAGALLLMSAGAAFAAPASPQVPQNNSLVKLVSDSQDVVRDESTGTVLHSTSGACVRTKWMDASDPCAPAEVAAPPAPPPAPVAHQEISREDRTVYFAFNQSVLTPEMKQRLDSLATRLHSDTTVKGARIVGYADRIGDKKYNEKLSKKRAETVRQYLVAKGILNTTAGEVRWEGSSDSVTDCKGKMKHDKLVACLQGDRRTEVEIDYNSTVTQ